jgi:DNA-binding IclR family transcriptional regulator
MEQPSATTIDKALDLLFHLHGQAAAPGLSQIARALDWPKSTTHRVLATLRARGVVERDARGGYRPGFALLALGLGALEREPVAVAARPVIEALAEQLGETIFLASARAGRLLVIDKCEGPGFLRAAPRVGSEIPVHATAIGKLYLAFAPGAVAGALDATPGFTTSTRTDAAALRADVDAARRHGWAINDEEWISGLTGIAAPVCRGEHLQGAIAVTGPSARFAGAARQRFTGATVDAATRIGRRLEGAET